MWPPTLPILLQFMLLCYCIWAKLECDPTSDVKKPDLSNPETYLYCNLEGSFSKRKCLSGNVFNATSNQCEPFKKNETSSDDPITQPFFHAPDDLCGLGLPLTVLSAPVICNPSITSCPDGYECLRYGRTDTSYCCQSPSSLADDGFCGSDQVAYIEPFSGLPRSCVLSAPSTCPTGFGCNLIGGRTTRCCGKDLGCPFNSAAFLHPITSSHVECSPGKMSSCQKGFSCVRSKSLLKHICCSSTESGEASCPGGESPLAHPSTCSASFPCPTGYICREEKCCPSNGVCPVGIPLGGGPTQCGEDIPCKEGYECVTSGGLQYCCPDKKKVCILERNSGVKCGFSRPVITRYYFDLSTGTCRSFQFSQCGGNANNFHSLEECEGFCVDTQCQNGQGYRIGGVNAACSFSSTNTCPRHYSCQNPLFGPNQICCPSAELTCNEVVSAGTPCFGRSITIQRFYFNPILRKCQAFQYYGCNGNGNNFVSMDDCKHFCLSAVDSVCGGFAPLMNPSQQLQQCSFEMPCPSGYNCNAEQYCCPIPKMACSTIISRGNVCSGIKQRTMWYYNVAQKKCSQFVYNGCGGTANRFSSRKICVDACMDDRSMGSCPSGMSSYTENDNITPKSCTLNLRDTCPPIASCVRSSTNRPICCQTITSCPDNRIPYIIPGSNSIAACNIKARDPCPRGNICMESSTVPGFYMCCSSSFSQRPPSSYGSDNKQPETLAALIRTISPCPPQLHSNGQTCTVNAVGECPRNHLCFREIGFEQGSCCRSPPLKCSQKPYVPVFITKEQVQICQIDLGGCPRDSRCMTSTIAKLAICCKKYQSQLPQNGKIKATSDLILSSTEEICKNGNRPYKRVNGEVQTCSFVQNSCPTGFKCEFSSTGNPVCCDDLGSIRCPVGSSVFEYGGRPLACPVGSTKCPYGYSCLPSLNPNYHLCCSTTTIVSTPQCIRGVTYIDPATNQRKFCSPVSNDCPVGYHCLESDHSGQYICCELRDSNDKFKGFCPPRQVPYVSRDGLAPTCHMQLNPCPTTAPYVCIYSPQKQDSYCCALVDLTVPNLAFPSVAAAPMKNPSATLPYREVSLNQFTIPPDMISTFARGPIGTGIGPIGLPDPIPGVSQEKMLPPSLRNSASGFFTQTLIPELSSTCPFASRPLVRADRTISDCSSQPCPNGFACVFTEEGNRFQCCSSSTIIDSDSSHTSSPSSLADVECPQGFFLINGKCLKVLFAGQKGCISDEQCSAREANATCDSGYCICPTSKPLVHNGKCITSCPEGFANIAGRCYDPTTVIFMDSVEERANGTIGGYCLETMIEEKKCHVNNSYCSEKTITCQCKIGYDLQMDFNNKNDKGTCQLIESSRYVQEKRKEMPTIEQDLYFIDINPLKTATEKANDTGNETYYERYLFQSDELTHVIV